MTSFSKVACLPFCKATACTRAVIRIRTKIPCYFIDPPKCIVSNVEPNKKKKHTRTSATYGAHRNQFPCNLQQSGNQWAMTSRFARLLASAHILCRKATGLSSTTLCHFECSLPWLVRRKPCVRFAGGKKGANIQKTGAVGLTGARSHTPTGSRQPS